MVRGALFLLPRYPTPNVVGVVFGVVSLPDGTDLDVAEDVRDQGDVIGIAVAQYDLGRASAEGVVDARSEFPARYGVLALTPSEPATVHDDGTRVRAGALDQGACAGPDVVEVHAQFVFESVG